MMLTEDQAQPLPQVSERGDLGGTSDLRMTTDFLSVYAKIISE
jgi:hypothetical protein